METEDHAAEAVTNAHSSIIKEGFVLPNASAPPANDEVTHL